MIWKFENNRIYSLDEDNNLMAETTFVFKGKEVNIDHTYVHPSLRGQGIAGKMMEIVVGYIREQNLKVTASCSYANTWLKRHRDLYTDIT